MSKEWTWKGDSFPGDRHGAGDGWVHTHVDGTRWVHLEKICPDPTLRGYGGPASSASESAEALLRQVVQAWLAPQEGNTLLDDALERARAYLVAHPEFSVSLSESPPRGPA